MWQPPYEIYNDKWVNEHKHLTLADIPGAYVSYHHAEGYNNCPLSVYYKNVCRAVDVAEHGHTMQGKVSKAFAGDSPDLLGKAFGIGLQYGVERAIEYYKEGAKTYNEDMVQELIHRINWLKSRLDARCRMGGHIEYEVPLRGEYKGVNIVGTADAVFYDKDKTVILEIKHTNNARWILAVSGQCEFYKTMLESVAPVDAFYVLFPSWQVKEASAEIQRGNGNLKFYYEALDKIISTPLDPIYWPCRGEIPRCKTCPVNKLCKSRNYCWTKKIE